jgi:hypothetical protein
MSDSYSQCPQCHHEPAAPLPVTEPCPACGIYPFKWGQHTSVPSQKPLTGLTLMSRWAAMDPKNRLRRVLAFVCLAGYASWRLLTLGTLLSRRYGFVLSRGNAPLVYQFLIFSASALAVFGTCLAVVYLIKYRADRDVAAVGDAIFQYLGLFFVLVVIYSIYLKSMVDGSGLPEFSLWSLAKFSLISALPFGVLAYSDQLWGSSEAAKVSSVAWIVVFGGFELKYPDACPVIWFLLFVPLLFSAQLGHTVGTLCARRDLLRA